LGISEKEMQDIRGNEIAMIFQEPRRSLDPSFSVGDQIAEVARRHLGVSRSEARARAVEMLDLVQIPDAAARSKEYPHTFSGGMCQRVMLAMALVCNPTVLIADEPTTALDVTVQARVLNLIADLRARLGLAVLFISHDLGVVAQVCDDVAVMYAGQIVETAPKDQLLRAPKHPYTEGLLASLPQSDRESDRLGSIGGTVPNMNAWPSGCRFHPRCSHRRSGCDEPPSPTLETIALKRQSRCLWWSDLPLKGVE
jgi:peptide/nickel transport system ATP-binding protein/oligopeptide transport system ATP-binding protein